MEITTQLLENAKTDYKLRNDIILFYLPYIKNSVFKYNPVIREDLMQECVFGVIDAINDFDPSFLANFKTYLHMKIKDRVSRFTYKENRNPFTIADFEQSITDTIDNKIDTDIILNSVTEKEKQIILNSVVYDEKFHEIQETQHLQKRSIENIRQIKIRAIQKIRKNFMENIIIDYNPIFCQLVGNIPPNLTTSLYETLSFYIQNHEFSDKFQSGRWDGTKRLFSKKTFKFRSGLLKRVIEIIDIHGVPFEVRYRPHINPLFTVTCPATDIIANARPYQKEAIQAILQYKRGGINLPPRTGKTIIAIGAAQAIDKFPFIFLCFQIEIALQTKEKFEKWTGEKIGLIGDGKCDIKPITICTVQSLASAYDKKWDFAVTYREEKKVSDKAAVKQLVENAEVVVCDEYHHYSCSTADEILVKCKQANYVIGLSATPWRNYEEETLLIERNIGPIIYKKSYSYMIKNNYLLQPHIYIYEVPKTNTQSRHYQTLYKECIIENDLRNEVIRKAAETLNTAGKSCAIIVSQIKHANMLQKMIPDSQLLIGKDDSAVRQTVLQALANKETLTVISTLMDEGIDLASLDAVIIAAGGQSSIDVFQRMRSLTPFEGKEKGFVIDFYDRNKYLVKHSRKRLDHYMSEEMFNIYYKKVDKNLKLTNKPLRRTNQV